eukprot:542893_1
MADNYFRSFDMGRINAISAWGYILDQYGFGGNGSIMINTLQGDEMGFNEITRDWQYADSKINCDSFVLNANEYINGYRCKYDDDYIYYIGFRTSLNNTHICNGIGHNDGSKTDTGWIMVDGAYLTGLEMIFNENFDMSIAANTFQFTYIPTSNPTIDPTITPTSITTAPTTFAPTTFAPTTATPTTLVPTTTFPTIDPTITPTSITTAPTTFAPTTFAPTTATPTTLVPTTTFPTIDPTI